MLIDNHTFRLAAGADEAAFLAADQRVQTEFAPFQPGFVRRTTARSGEGEWLVAALWYSATAAGDADAAATSHPAAREFAGFIDAATSTHRRYETLD